MVYVLLLPAKGDKNVSDETPKSIKDVSRLVHLRAHDAPDRDRTRFEKKAVEAYSGRLAKKLSEIAIIGVKSSPLCLRWLRMIDGWRCRPVMKFRSVDSLQANCYAAILVNRGLTDLAFYSSPFEGVCDLERRTSVGTKSECVCCGKQKLHGIRIRFPCRSKLVQVD